jgi:hypothetical protein
MVDAKPVCTPMVTTVHLSAYDGEVLSDPTLYCCIVGVLQYLSIIRPDIAFTINRLSQFMHNPLLSSCQMALKVSQTNH